ncbi:hypothetical protein E2P81_ATG08546 [Venturia nashicola]|uniref:PH domain-containing protein n=1 Tax=Venturia nashicola TaxID=86259 RepID=A0A4Z1NGX9_9PEZI|nr:hypothetical protein E6O75_ATG08743 [Venturia nashicola]TLD20882.1 hypothetical protein E2P81_ATG08546 [Venturia nashicola]
MPVDDNRLSLDPFLGQPQDEKRHRYSGFDNTLFSLYANGSPSQAKRALEAHLLETERRLNEASKLGQVLIDQRKELEDKLQEVETQQQHNEITPELKKRLLELENEVNEVSRDTARAFVLKNRGANEGADETTTNSTIFASDSRQSPSKVQAPSRKQRNQTPSRVNDLKLATDISTTLINQVRDLQAAVSEKDAALKAVTQDKDLLEQDFESLRQRLRAMDESEQRFKDENWSLETQVHELTGAHKEAADKVHKLTNNLNLVTTAKDAVEREFEELKQQHGKLSEDHTTVKKHHEAEIGTLKRNAVNDDAEKSVLQKKVEDLISQNKELAVAVSYRLGVASRQVSAENAADGDDPQEGDDTPGNSPPGSPSKATPRHGPLQAETLQSSLNHAHRQIQGLRNQLHREKTEKIEYRRLLQEARDELEAKRNGNDSGKKRRSKEPDLIKKTAKLDRLGAARQSREEIILDDPDWEDHEDAESTPSKSRTIPGAYFSAGERSGIDSTADNYATATENSDAFETADDRGATETETDAFQTGAETLDGNSSDELTETEAGPAEQNSTIRKRPAVLTRYSFQSTASNSGDEFDDYDLRTPVQQTQPKYKLRISRGGQRRVSGRMPSDVPSEEATSFDSPSSLASNNSTPIAVGQSLFAELGNLSDPDTEEGTPRSSGVLSPITSPDPIRKSPAPSRLRESSFSDVKPTIKMVDTGVMTEPWEPESKSVLSTAADVAGAAVAGGVGFLLGHGSKPDGEHETDNQKHVTKHSDEPQSPRIVPSSTDPVEPLVSETRHVPVTERTLPPAVFAEKPKLSISTIVHQHTEPISPVPAVVSTSSSQSSNILSQHIEPIEVKRETPEPVGANKGIEQNMSHSVVVFQHTEPEAAPVESIPKPVAAPMEMPVQPMKTPLTFSAVIHQESEPVEPPMPVLPLPVGKIDQGTETDLPPLVPDRADRTAKTVGVAAGAGLLGALLGRKSQGDKVSAEDDASQPTKEASKKIAEPSASRATATDVRTPFREINGNAPPSPERKPVKDSSKLVGKPLKRQMASESTQTMLSSSEIDRMLKNKSAAFVAPVLDPNARSLQTSPLKPTISYNSRPRSRDSVNTIERIPRRPGSSSSMRSRAVTPPPPLPVEAKQTIEGAVLKTPGPAKVAQVNVMGPPVIPASALRGSTQFRPRTPLNTTSGSPLKDRTVRQSMSNPGSRSAMASPATTRHSSVTSFASELDQRFNIASRNVDGEFSDPNITDPRMIQAITQTMIGEFLFKYTRKAGREEISNSRHRRFFWVHPYTRTLYWSDEDPSVGKTQLKSKSVAIEAVRVVSDNNPMPPGLHHKSLIVITPGRSLKFTAPTAQRHETWFNALSYLLLRSNNDQEDDGGMTAEDVAEFNPGYTPGYFRSSSRATGRSRMSVSSVMSRRTGSPTKLQHSTLRAPSAASHRTATSQSAAPGGSVASRFSGIFKTTSARSTRGSMTSRYSKQDTRAYDGAGSEVHDSAEDLRAVIEAQERDPDRLENVRACCNGAHDVGSLSRTGRHGKGFSHSHEHHH